MVKKKNKANLFFISLFSIFTIFSFYNFFIIFIPLIPLLLYFLEKYKSIPLIYRYILAFIILYLLDFLYKIYCIENNNLNVEYCRTIMAWLFFITFTYIVYVSIRYIRFSLPDYFFSRLSLFILFIIGVFYVFYITEQLNQQYKLYKLHDLTVYYLKIFTPVFCAAGILSVIGNILFSDRKFLKILIWYIGVAYVLAFFFSFISVFLGYMGYESLFMTFPLNIITWIIVGLSTQTSFLLAFGCSIWTILLLFLSKINDNRTFLYAKISLIVIFIIFFLFSLSNLSQIFYPFNTICLN